MPHLTWSHKYHGEEVTACNFSYIGPPFVIVIFRVFLTVQQRAYAYKLYKWKKTSDVKVIFARRVVNVRNNSLTDTVGFATVAAFKRSIIIVNYSVF